LRDANWELWNVFKNQTEAAIHIHVRVKKLNVGKQKKALWMTTKAVHTVKKKRRLFSRYKDNKHPAYTKASVSAKKEIKRAKRNFESKLCENIKKDTKSFYAYVRSQSKSSVKVGPLVEESGSIQ